MNRSGKCPKCGGRDILRFDGSVGPYGVGNNVLTGASIFSAVNVNRYVCCGCGFTEEWIDPQDIERLKSSKKAKRPV